jgi:hypothetical protein
VAIFNLTPNPSPSEIERGAEKMIFYFKYYGPSPLHVFVERG